MTTSVRVMCACVYVCAIDVCHKYKLGHVNKRICFVFWVWHQKRKHNALLWCAGGIEKIEGKKRTLTASCSLLSLHKTELFTSPKSF